ncbi:hypothetical protein DXG01_003788 [Tephrocybe rancida]|nr:hypothetical protein DXG01_003788 [Tephrocybe rancida]
MSSAVLIEQRPPFILLLASRIPTYAHILISVLAIILFKAFPSLAIAKPPVRVISPKPRSGSLTSTTSTLVDTDNASNKDVSDKEKQPRRRHVSFSTKIPFNRIGTSMKVAISRSKSIKPLARRLSIPARRLSTQVVNAIHHLTPHLTPHHHHQHHHHTQNEAGSYFSSKASADIEVVRDEKVVETVTATAAANASTPLISTSATEKVTEVVIETAQSNVEINVPASLKRGSTFKRVARRASVVLGITHRS